MSRILKKKVKQLTPESYIFDKNENCTHVIIPINEWNAAVNQSSDKINSVFYENMKNVSGEDCLYHENYLVQHIDSISKLIGCNNSMKKENWLNIYDRYFSYYDSLNKYEIELLYFFRAGILFNANENEEETHINYLYNKYGLTNHSNQKIQILDYQKLVSYSYLYNEFSFLQYFNMHFKLKELKIIKNERISRKSERDKLFLYDLIVFSEYLNEVSNDLEDKNKFKYLFLLGKKTIIETLSKLFYNGNKSQVYRAKAEVEKILTLIN